MKLIDYSICFMFIFFTFISLSCETVAIDDSCYYSEEICCDSNACNYSYNYQSCNECNNNVCYFPGAICYGDVNNNNYYDIAISIGGCDIDCSALEGNWSYSIKNGIEQGCMIPAASNYSYYALEDDGSCHGGSGCTNIFDAEYDYWATIDDDSCINP